MEILIVVLLYEIVTIGGVSLILHNRAKKRAEHHKGESSFLVANRDLPVIIVGVSLGFSVLGAVHVFGIMEMAWNLGAVTIWFSIAHVVLLCVICLATGRWVRRMRVSTVPELIRKLFGKKLALVCTCVIAGQTFAILTLETQALGIIFNTLTLHTVSIQTGAIIGGVIGVTYVIFAGMAEIAWLNIINTIVMYTAVILAMVFLSGVIPEGWVGVENYYAQIDESYMTSIWGAPGMFLAFGVSNIVAVTFAQSISQMGTQTAMAAKNERTIIKSLWIATAINGIFGIFTMAMGIAAKFMVKSGHLAVEGTEAVQAKTAGITMLVNYLPTWLVMMLLAAFLGTVVHTFAMTTMGVGGLFVRNIYTLKYPNATETQQSHAIRVIIIIAAIVAVGVGSFLPSIVNGANWAFAWLCPIFWNTIYGLFWKRSRTASGWVFGVSWLSVLLWTYTPLPAVIGLHGIPVPFVTLFVSIVLGVILNLILPGEMAYFKERKLDQEKRNVYA